MRLEPHQYVPSLKSRQAETLALCDLHNKVKEQVVPLITIPPIEFDFERNAPAKSVHDHVVMAASRIKNRWPGDCWLEIDSSLDGETMQNGLPVMEHLILAINDLCQKAIPMLKMDSPSSLITPVKRCASHHGVAVRITFSQLTSGNLNNELSKAIKDCNVSVNDVDLFIDLGAPKSYEPYDRLAKSLMKRLQGIQKLSMFRNVVIVGTAIPKPIPDIGTNITSFRRHEWYLYEELSKVLSNTVEVLNFSDYTIVHPEFRVDLDLRFVKPSGKLIYTTPTDWLVVKGEAFQKNPSQMHDHCQQIVNHPDYEHPAFSWGDQYIHDCARKITEPSNLTTWKRVGINHHMTAVARDLATLHGAS